MSPDMNNTSTAVQQQCAAIYTDSKEVKIIKTALCSAIMGAALIGNLFVLFIVYKKKTMRRTTNIFIANMAASDMFIAVFVIPRQLADLYIGPQRWIVQGILGEILCKACFVMTDYSVCISITSHVVIAIDRFCAIVYPLRTSPITPARRKHIIALIWFYSFVLHSPNLYTYRLKQQGGQTYCRIDWTPLDTVQSQKIFFTVIFIFVLCIPIFLMTVLYTWLVMSLTRQNVPNAAQTLELRQQRRKEDVIVLRNVVVMATVFLVSLMPITLLAMLSYYSWDQKLPCSAWGFTFSAHVLLVSNSAINPWLCILLHQSYRLYLQKTLCGKRHDMATRKRDLTATDTKANGCDLVCATQEENEELFNETAM